MSKRQKAKQAKDLKRNPDRRNGKAWKRGLSPEVRAKQEAAKREN